MNVSGKEILFLKLLMCIFKLLIQISLIIGNLHLANKVTHIVNKTVTKKTNKTKKQKAFRNISLYSEVTCNYSC